MKSVLSKSDAERVAITHNPQKFPKAISSSAHAFVAKKGQTGGLGATSFRLDPMVAEQTGVAELERVSLEERVEREALLRLKDLQEQAYKEGYELGRDEGRDKAFVENQVQLNGQIESLSALLRSMENMKVELVDYNEAQIVELIFYLTKRLLADEIAARPEVILGIVREAIESTQSDEALTVKVSPRDFAFIETVKGKLGKDFESIQRARLEGAESVSDGGCIVTTAFGDVNATIEQRLAKLWTVLAEKLNKTTNVQTEKKDG